MCTLLEDNLGHSGILIDRFLVVGVLWPPDLENNQVACFIIKVLNMTFDQNIESFEGQIVEKRFGVATRGSFGFPQCDD